ncbi:hypothetical protein F5Y15DRAFT_106634 [Xylariaceae sp. FL0016]|nr:hypothetical protein F5Y15DRAFT_106634 [Xylariaceae sp. FL0016]
MAVTGTETPDKTQTTAGQAPPRLTKPAPNVPATPGASTKDEARKARKRATDRKSQQNHRRRQKAYVKQLEESMKAFERQCEADSDERLATLIEAHRKLEQRYDKATSLLARVRGILNDDLEAHARSASPVSEAQGEKDNRPVRRETTTNYEANEQTSALELERTPMMATSDPELHDTAWEMEAATEKSLPAALDSISPELNLPIPIGVPIEGHDSSEDMVNEYIDLAEDQGPASALDIRLRPNGLELFPANHIANLSPNVDASLCGFNPAALLKDFMPFGLESRPLQTLYSYGPLHSPAVGAGARALENMVLEAKAEHAGGRFGQGEPSLRGLLTDGSGDVLAFRLFHYLSCYGEMPMHIFLGIFWVQYLVLRWQVLGTEEDYLRLPNFMRPHIVERQIPHSIVIDLFVWPDLRNALIKQCADQDAEAIGMDLVKHLNSSWSPSAPPCDNLHGTSSMIACIDIMKIIERQASSWDFWKIDPGFLCEYTQFIDCHLS